MYYYEEQALRVRLVAEGHRFVDIAQCLLISPEAFGSWATRAGVAAKKTRAVPKRRKKGGKWYSYRDWKVAREWAWALQQRHHITPEEYGQLYRKQEGCCAICGVEKPLLLVDHDHRTGLVRGLLCSPCNRGLGFFKDNAITLQNASRYLQDHSATKVGISVQTTTG